MSGTDERDYGALLKRALLAIDQLEAKVASLESERAEPIAIVGIGCRMPGGVESAEEFWEMLRSGVDAVTEVPPERWDISEYYDPDPDAIGKAYTRWGSFLKNVEMFDAEFFGVSPREAASLDPAQRLLLETAWEALENAAIAPSSLAGSQTSVYVGLSGHDYSTRPAVAGQARYVDAYAASGGSHSMASGRIAYVLGLHGPNMAIDTACSSSLVAIHEGVQSLRTRAADVSLAGGANLTLAPEGSVMTSRARMMSFDGRCKTFDASADGYVRGEACGLVVMKRLADAQRDGDTILAVIRGTAVNQDGRSGGLTVPNGAAQRMVIRAALASAQLEPSAISYVEAHGTGTSLGDPIEVKALAEVFGERPADKPLLLGSAKTNIGHTEAAAGIVGLIKAVLVLRHRQIPPHLHLRKPNPLIAWDQYPVAVPTALTEWSAPQGTVRRAGVSSFGFSGTNAHAVLEEGPAGVQPEISENTERVLILSARTPEALTEMARRWQAYLSREDAVPFADAVATAALGRAFFAERLAIVANSNSDAAAKLAAFTDGNSGAGILRGRAAVGAPPEVAFLFTGQGAQYAGMAKQLYDTDPAFRAALDECATLLAPHLARPLFDVLFGTDAALIDDTAYTQPSLFAVEYALAQLWKSWGVEPIAVMGHSVGEYVAACMAGVFSLEDALRLIAARGRLMSALPRDGSMAAVFATEADVRPALAGLEHDVSVAATNGPRNTVISGRTAAVDAVLARLAANGIEAQRLNVSHAFHSPLMDPILDEFQAIASTATFAAPEIGLVSNVSGTMAGSEVASPAYWRRHIRDGVRFAESVATLQREGYRVFLEAGPQPTLLGMAKRCAGAENVTMVGSLRKGRDDRASILEALGNLFVNGVHVDWKGVIAGDGRRRANLPTYPFQRQRFWQEFAKRDQGAALLPTRTAHPMLGGAVPSAVRIFQKELSLDTHPWLADHQILDFTPLPAAAFLEIAMAAAREVHDTLACTVRDVTIAEALMLVRGSTTTVQTVVTTTPEGTEQVQVFSRASAASEDSSESTAPARWRLHFSGTIEVSREASPDANEIAALVSAVTDRIEVQHYYDRLASQGAMYGPAFRGITEITGKARDVVGRVVIPASSDPEAGSYMVHPALLDSCVQLTGVVLMGTSEPTYLPVGIGSYRVYADGVAAARCFVRVYPAPSNADTLSADLTLFDDQNNVIAMVSRLDLRRINQAALRRVAARSAGADTFFATEWRSTPAAPIVEPADPGRWLILADASGVGTSLAALLRARGAHVTVASHSGTDGAVHVDEGDAAALSRVIEDAKRGQALTGIVSLWALNATARRTDGNGPVIAAERALHDALALVHAAANEGSRVWIVTRGSQAVASSVPDIAQAPVWAFGGVAASEYPASQCVRIDLDPAARPDDVEKLFAAVWSPDDEVQIAYRDGIRHVARLAPAVGVSVSDRELARRLEIPTRGSLENLALQRAPRELPGPGEVEIRVHATGLNFRDVLNALGMYPGDPGPLGNECAGVITAVGEGVTDLRVGDAVVSMINKSFATYVIAPVSMTVHKPASLTFADAATIPVTFLTAEYGLSHLAKIKKGDRVLIHAATGGVGMAATQIALRAGAIVYGTAGSPAKKALARSLGVHHVSDSRSLSFVDDILRATNGEGVDIVLNSLADDFIPASLGLLKRGGHFIEIGKRGIWDAASVAEKFPGVAYHALYLGEIAVEQPLFIREMLRRLLVDFDAGLLTPLPQRLYPIEKAEEAFRFMAQGLHTGKIVITQQPAPEIRDNASYIVTGGLGGLGLLVGKWLVEQGARHIVLAGRKTPSANAQKQIDAMTASGAVVTISRTDVADAAQVTAMLRQIEESGAPLRGIIHAAGIVEDAMLPGQTMESIRRVMAPKVRGAWNLHEQTQRLPLDFFVMFSSTAVVMGSPGQANYAAANAFLDALAWVRRSRGLTAVSINWGTWSDVGMAAAVSGEHHRRWAAMGLQMITPETGPRFLYEVLFGSSMPQVVVAPLVRSKLPQTLGPYFREIVTRPAQRGAAPAVPTADLAKRLTSASDAERGPIVTNFLTDQVTRVLALSSTYRVDPARSLMDMGMDSLMAMELRNRIQTAAKVNVSVATLLEGTSIERLTRLILESVGPAAAAGATTAGSEIEEGTL